MYYIGVDLGGTNIAAGLVSEKGEILYKKSVLTLKDRGYEQIIKDIANLCDNIINEKGLQYNNIKSIGIGCPGSCDIDKGMVTYSCNLDFYDVPIIKEMEKHTKIPVFFENDANCAALGESICGAAKGYKNSITITLGTGVGGGIIINGKIYSGSFSGGAELGHMVVQVDGESCGCGRKGCWEAYVSASALIREARIAAARYPNSEIFNLVNGNIKLIDAKIPFDAAEKGDSVAKGIINNYFKYMAEGLSNLINIFQPEIIAIGGGVCAQGENIIKPVTKLVKGMVYGGVLKTKIVTATLGNDAGIIGAAMLE